MPLLRQLFDSYGTLQGLRITGRVILDHEKAEREEFRFRYCLGYRESENHLPPMSLEALIPNPGEPHLPDAEIADRWEAFDGHVMGVFKREFVGQSRSRPRSRLSQVDLHPGYFPRLMRFADDMFHVGPYGMDNCDELGTFNAIDDSNVSVASSIGEFQGYPLVELKRFLSMASDAAITTRIALGATPFIVTARDDIGLPRLQMSRLTEREVVNLAEREGVLLPIHARCQRSDPYAFFETRIDQVERIEPDFRGLWRFDQTGTTYTDHGRGERWQIPFSDEEKGLIGCAADERIDGCCGAREPGLTVPRPQIDLTGYQHYECPQVDVEVRNDATCPVEIEELMLPWRPPYCDFVPAMLEPGESRRYRIKLGQRPPSATHDRAQFVANPVWASSKPFEFVYQAQRLRSRLDPLVFFLGPITKEAAGPRELVCRVEEVRFPRRTDVTLSVAKCQCRFQSRAYAIDEANSNYRRGGEIRIGVDWREHRGGPFHDTIEVTAACDGEAVTHFIHVLGTIVL